MGGRIRRRTRAPAAAPRPARGRRASAAPRGAPSPPPGSAAAPRSGHRSGPRWRTPGGGAGPAAVELRDIEAAAQALTASLRERRPERGPAQDQRQAIDTLLAHLHRHGPSLFGHVIRLPPRVGGGIRLVDRTNNSLEGLVDDIKHGERRRSGRKILTQDLEQLPPAAALATNLRSNDDVALGCGTLDQLPQAFAQLDAAIRRRSALVARAAARTADANDGDVVSASLPRVDRVLLRTEPMDRRIRAAARSRAPHR